MNRSKQLLESLNLVTESDEAKIIRTALKKKLGLSNRDVSVKSSSYTAVNVGVKSMKALGKMKEIEAIGKSQEHIDRDERSGEILMGGNTFIFVEIDYDFRKKLVDIVQKEFVKQTGGKGNLEDKNSVVLFKTFEVNKSSNGPVFVNVKGKLNPNTEVRDMNYVGEAVIGLISHVGDDSLYSKIK